MQAVEPQVATLARHLRSTEDGLLLVLTGAGVSRASGIPTFRGTEPGAIWRRDDVEIATRQCLLRDPLRQWRWYVERFAVAERAQPNPAHRALAELERWQLGRGGRFLLVTQNVDTLHEQAGSQELVKVHGSLDRLRCAAPGCCYGAPDGSMPRSRFAAELARFRTDPSLEAIPRCPACGSLLRAHALFFDEYYHEHRDYQFARVEAAAADALLVLFVGTSFSVGVTDLVVRTALWRGIPLLSIDPGAATPAGAPGIRTLAAPAEELLPEVCRVLDLAR